MGFKSGLVIGMMVLWGFQHPQKVMAVGKSACVHLVQFCQEAHSGSR